MPGIPWTKANLTYEDVLSALEAWRELSEELLIHGPHVSIYARLHDVTDDEGEISLRFKGHHPHTAVWLPRGEFVSARWEDRADLVDIEGVLPLAAIVVTLSDSEFRFEGSGEVVAIPEG